MESQNHFYGHSAALAAYLGRKRPRHISGLVQHGWTALSPVATHFRDFPSVGRDGEGSCRLLVWSHKSRGWDPSVENRATTPMAAPFVYLCSVAGEAPSPRDAREEVVLMPVHGIQTQRVFGDHSALAQRWRDEEGPATACLYAADAQDPDIVNAYRDAGHRLVILGDRMDPAFLWRLWTMLGRARRVVSNRLSTPVLYAAYLGASIGVYGDALHIEGEATGDNTRVRDLWPELHGTSIGSAAAEKIGGQELGAEYLLGSEELERTLGWDRTPLRPATAYWTSSPAQRAIINVRRKATVSAPATGDSPPDALGWTAWLRAAMSYLPHPIPTSFPTAGSAVEPLNVDEG